MGVVTEGIMNHGGISGPDMDINFLYCAIPMSMQGADDVELDISARFCKAGLVIGGWWLTRSNSQTAAQLPPYPVGDIYCIGWSDRTTVRQKFIDDQPIGGGYAVYTAYEQSIDAFFDTYFYKSASSSRLGAAGTVPDTLTTYRGICGWGVAFLNRYGRSSAVPVIEKSKSFGLLRGPVYWYNGYGGSIKESYHEGVGNVNTSAQAFGVDVADPYGVGSQRTGTYLYDPSGLAWAIKNTHNGGLVYKNVNTASYSTQSCIFPNAGTGDSGLIPNNYSSFRQTIAGITFPGTTGTLAKYQEYTAIVPTITFGGAAGGVAYTTQSGKAVVIGGKVDFSMTIVLSSKGSSTGNLSIIGLPVSASADGSATCSVRVAAMAAGAGPYFEGFITGGLATVRVFGVSAGVAADLTDAAFSNTSTIQVSGTYFTI